MVFRAKYRSRNSDLGVERSRNSDLGVVQARQAGGFYAGQGAAGRLLCQAGGAAGRRSAKPYDRMIRMIRTGWRGSDAGQVTGVEASMPGRRRGRASMPGRWRGRVAMMPFLRQH